MIRNRIIEDEIVYDFLNLDLEDDMEIIVTNLSNNYKVEIIDKIEGPGTIIWEIQINKHEFYLVNNSWGNFLKPLNKSSIEFIDQELDILNSW